MWNRYKIAILLLIILLSAVARSQNSGSSIIVDAVLWTSGNDTIHCKLLYINQYSLQFNMTIVDTSGTPLGYYSPKDLDGFCYSMQDDEVEYRSMPNPVDMGRIFLRLVYSGQLSLYQYLEINNSSPTFSFLVSYYLWDGKWKTPPLTMAYEKESLLYHFSDCPELEYKIKTGIYGLVKIETIMREYEKCKLTDEYEFFYE